MKKIVSNFNLVIFSSVILFMASCAKDNSTLPGVDDRDKYEGSWTCKETVQGQAPTSFTISISSSGTADTLLVSNFNQLGNSFKTLWLVSDNSVTIPSQQVDQTSISGFGIYNKPKINLNYTVDSESVTAECTKL